MNHETVDRPKLLVSVRNAAEVSAALAGGADWIDLKEPNAGPLAPVRVHVAKEALQTLAGRRTMSAALGELFDWDESPAAGLLRLAGISVVKLGLAGCSRLNRWQHRWQAVAEHASKHDKQLAAVIYADWQQAAAPACAEILALAQTSGCRYLLIDTYNKSSGCAFDHFSSSELAAILYEAKASSMTTVLAGSLSLMSIAQVPDGLVDMIAVRGAVCRGDRTARVEAELVEGFRQALAVRFDSTRQTTSAVG